MQKGLKRDKYIERKYMKNKSIYLLCAVCLAMTACRKTTDNALLIQQYANTLYSIFKNYDVATPHTYEQYFTEEDISPYYIGETVDIDVGDHAKKSECTTVTFADIDGDSVSEMCLSRM